jgi:hypothetical protein
MYDEVASDLFQKIASPEWVKLGKFRSEQIFSGLPPRADLRSAR